MAVTEPTITPTSTAGMYSENYASIHDVVNKPEYIQKIYNKYGQGVSLVQTFRSMGQTGTYANDEIKAIEKDRPIRAVTVDSVSNNNASSGVQVTLTDATTDTNGDSIFRQYDEVVHQKTSGEIQPCYITAVTDNANDDTLTLSSYDGNNISISSGDTLTMGSNSYAHGTDQPSGLAVGYFDKTFKTAIIKEQKELDGAELAQVKWVETPTGRWNEILMELEFMMDFREDVKCTIGQENDNSLTQTSPVDSASRDLRSTKGLWQHLESDAGTLNYGTNSDWYYKYFEDIEAYFRTMNITNRIAGFYMGNGLMNKLENSSLEFIKEFSGGTDLTRIADKAYGGNKDLALEVGFQVIKKAGITYVCHVIHTFSADIYLGNYLSNSGFIAPYGDKVKDPKSGLNLPNLGVYYRAKDGVNRKRVINVYNGMTGANMGVPATLTYDAAYASGLSEFAVICMETEKMIQVNDR